jgi:DNA-damage-inducible protein D
MLNDSPNPSDYIKKMRKRDVLLSLGWGQLVTPLVVETADGNQKLNCAHVHWCCQSGKLTSIVGGGR